jgi:hypothetical protein
MTKILLPVILENYRPRKDGSVGLSFSTQELTIDKVVEVHSLLNSYGILHFKAGEKMTAEDIALVDNVDMDLNNGKSQSQRLRGVLFILWEQSGSVGDFKEFYRVHTEKIITHYKSKLKDQ